MSEATGTKWYDKKGLVILLCVIFFPVGLYGLWKNQSISKGWKIGVTIFWGLVVLGNMGNKNTDVDSGHEASVRTPELTQAKKDSIALAEEARKEEQAKEAKAREIEERRKVTIDANDLCLAYSGNEVRADENYKGKTIYVTGSVKSIEKGNGSSIVILAGGPDDDINTDVYCEVRDQAAASKLDKGQWITVRGVCKGRAKDLNVFSGAEMKNCVVVENLEDLEAALQ